MYYGNNSIWILYRGIDRIYKINIGLRFSKFGFVGENTCGKCHIVKPWMGKNRVKTLYSEACTQQLRPLMNLQAKYFENCICAVQLLI